MEQLMYFSIFFNSDKDEDRTVTKRELLDYLYYFNPDAEVLKAQLDLIDYDKCGFADADEIHKVTTGRGFIDTAAGCIKIIYQYIDKHGNSNGVFSELDLARGVEKLVEWKEQFIEDIEELKFGKFNGVTYDEMQILANETCPQWNMDLLPGFMSVPEEEAADEETTVPEDDSEPEADVVKPDDVEEEESTENNDVTETTETEETEEIEENEETTEESVQEETSAEESAENDNVVDLNDNEAEEEETAEPISPEDDSNTEDPVETTED
jgi:hypothetical protein